MDTEIPPYSGVRLRELVLNPLPLREPIIEQFLYEHSVLMTYAKSGVGKSVITLCGAAQGSSGTNIFGYFECTRPLKFYYVLGERDIYEPAERLQLMHRVLNINYDNLFIDAEAAGRDLLDHRNERWLIERIKANAPDVDVIVLDPIYALVSGGLSTPDKATAFAQFSTRLQHAFNCAIWLNNHTTKQTEDIINGIRVPREDPFMGSEFLKAHITIAYYIQQRDNNVTFDCKKDNHNVAMKHFQLAFDPETFILSFQSSNTLTVMQRAEDFIEECKKLDKKFTFAQFHARLYPTTVRYTQKVLGVTLKRGKIINLSGKFDKALYQVL